MSNCVGPSKCANLAPQLLHAVAVLREVRILERPWPVIAAAGPHRDRVRTPGPVGAGGLGKVGSLKSWMAQPLHVMILIHAPPI